MVIFVVRMFLLGVYIAVASCVCVAFSIFRPFNPYNVWITGRIFGWAGMFFLGIKRHMEGLENFEGNTPAIIISNHQSNIDMFLCGSVVPPGGVSMGKTSIKYFPFFGQSYWLSGNILINRSNTREAIRTMKKVVTDLHDKKMSVWIMPEGTRNRGKGLLRYKKGAFRTAIQAGVPIIPVCYSSFVNHMNLKKFKSMDVGIKVLPPISTEGMNVRDAGELAERCHDIMKKEIEALDKKILALEA